MQHFPTKRTSYKSEIDGLRAFAVLSVVAFHAFPSLVTGGFIGVDVFFVISGFLISTHIFESFLSNQFSFVDFFSRRIRRLFPALILVMACSLLFAWFVLFPDEYKQLGKHIVSGTLFFSNFVFVSEAGYFDNAAETKPMLHLWSLAVEEQFYIIWPFLLWLAWKRKFNLLNLTIAVTVLSFCFNLYFVKKYPTPVFFLPFGRFWEILSGSILAWVFVFKEELLLKLEKSSEDCLLKIIPLKKPFNDVSIVSELMSFTGVFLLAISICIINEKTPFPSIWTLLPIIATLLIILSGSKPFFSRIFLVNRIAIWFGLISYPLYLWHWPIFSYLRIIVGEEPSFITIFFATLMCILLAWLTYRFIETPIRKQFLLSPKVKHLCVSIFVIGISALAIYQLDGVRDRKIIVQLDDNFNQLNRTKSKEAECLAFLNLGESKFDYCKISKIGSKGVVAVIGDSHAHAAFPGIAKGLSELGYTSLLLANSSCPPFINSPWGRNQNEKLFCNQRIDQIISSLGKLKDIEKVIIFSRGPVYWTGFEPSAKVAKQPSLEIDPYFEGMQKTINHIHSMGSDVLYVTENPNLKYQSRSCLQRIFSFAAAKKCEQEISAVNARQQIYRERLNHLNNVTIIDSNNAFCREKDQKCSAFSADGKLLYADDNHLSVLGSIQQYEFVIKPLIIN